MTEIPKEVPLRVDFAGSWLDHPDYCRIMGGHVVNMTIEPLVSKDSWPYHIGSGLGGSAARAILYGKDPVENELAIGAGWQDAAVIQETGLCTWISDKRPNLGSKSDPAQLYGLIALLWTGVSHNTPSLASRPRNYDMISEASYYAAEGVDREDLGMLSIGVNLNYRAQLLEGMDQLPFRGEVAAKYCGGGHGGYAMYIYGIRDDRNKAVEKHRDMIAVEPYVKN